MHSAVGAKDQEHRTDRLGLFGKVRTGGLLDLPSLGFEELISLPEPIQPCLITFPDLFCRHLELLATGTDPCQLPAGLRVELRPGRIHRVEPILHVLATADHNS